MSIAYIAMGSNLGDRAGALDRAAADLGRIPGVRVTARSRNHETTPIGGPAGQGDYLNAVLAIETELPPRDLLGAMQGIELSMGRPPAGQRVHDGPRVIDLDLLLYDTRVIDEPGLNVPHPRMHLRRFVLEPLTEIAPHTRHPLLGATAAEMLAWLPAGGHA